MQPEPILYIYYDSIYLCIYIATEVMHPLPAQHQRHLLPESPTFEGFKRSTARGSQRPPRTASGERLARHRKDDSPAPTGARKVEPLALCQPAKSHLGDTAASPAQRRPLAAQRRPQQPSAPSGQRSGGCSAAVALGSAAASPAARRTLRAAQRRLQRKGCPRQRSGVTSNQAHPMAAQRRPQRGGPRQRSGLLSSQARPLEQRSGGSSEAAALGNAAASLTARRTLWAAQRRLQRSGVLRGQAHFLVSAAAAPARRRPSAAQRRLQQPGAPSGQRRGGSSAAAALGSAAASSAARRTLWAAQRRLQRSGGPRQRSGVSSSQAHPQGSAAAALSMPARGPRPTLHMFSQPAFTASPLPPAPGTVGLAYSAYRRARLKKRDRALITTSSSDAASHSSAPQANADLCIHLRHGPLSSVWRILRQRYTLRTAYIIAKALFSSVWRTRHSIITSLSTHVLTP